MPSPTLSTYSDNVLITVFTVQNVAPVVVREHARTTVSQSMVYNNGSIEHTHRAETTNITSYVPSSLPLLSLLESELAASMDSRSS